MKYINQSLKQQNSKCADLGDRHDSEFQFANAKCQSSQVGEKQERIADTNYGHIIITKSVGLKYETKETVVEEHSRST